MSEFRQDSLTRDWVIVVPERSARPHTKNPASGDCPFCPGREDRAGNQVLRLDDADGQWLLRVIENRFPILRPGPGEAEPDGGALRHRLAGCGRHEIVIDARDHDATLGSLAPEQLRRLLGVYLDRYRALASVAGIREVVIFRNQGEQAGASLRHPHSQIVATPVVSPVTRRRIMDEIAYFDDHGECALCRTLAGELEAGERVVLAGRHFVSFTPFAARASHHLRIVPLRHRPRFDEITAAELDDLALHLSRLFGAFEAELANPDHNMVIASPPLDLVHQGASHWFVEIVPRLAIPAGFEIGSGIAVTTCAPEAAAAALRERLTSADRSDA